MQVWLWSLGKQVVRHNQLIPGASMWEIICITYCWNDDSPVKCIRWTPERGTKGVIEEFDKLVKKADHFIGKNSDRFDTKIINAQRMLQGLPGLPEWTKYTDDLEKQMRKYFRLPSQALDYISDQKGFGGKYKMEFSDWIAISRWMELSQLELSTKEIKNANQVLNHVCWQRYNMAIGQVLSYGKKAMTKMCTYGMKDTEDTRNLWNLLSEHFEPKFNQSTYQDNGLSCMQCGSKNIKPNGSRYSGKYHWKQFICKVCHRYAGRIPMASYEKSRGRIG